MPLIGSEFADGYTFGAQLIPGLARPWPGPLPRMGTALARNPEPCHGYGQMTQPGLELGYFLTTNKRQRDLALSPPYDGCVEKEGCGLGCGGL